MDFLHQILDIKFFFFAVSCGTVSLIVLIVDIIITKTQNKKSLLGITSGEIETWKLMFMWWIAAAIVGYLVTMIGILNTTPQAVITIGILWPYAFSKIIKNAHSILGEDEPEDKPEVEEK